MAKFCSTVILNQACSYIKTNVKRMVLMTSTPANLAACTAATCLAGATMSTAEFTIADGDVSGKKVTVSQMATLAVRTTGIPSHVVLFSTAVGTTGIHYYTTCSTAQALTSTANTVTVPAWDIEFRDAT